MLWLAWKIATAVPPSGTRAEGRPLTFLQAAAFQWVNPKAWAMAISIPATFVTGKAPVQEALICTAALVMAGITSAPTWTGFGAVLRRWLSTDLRLRLFNGIMGVLVAGSALYLAIAEI
jgi:threonine/homoserine/homoserine lactone efflux protein